MKSFNEILKYLKRHKNIPDLHSVIINTEHGDFISIDYSNGCYNVNSNVKGNKTFIQENDVINFISDNIYSYEM